MVAFPSPRPEGLSNGSGNRNADKVYEIQSLPVQHTTIGAACQLLH